MRIAHRHYTTDGMADQLDTRSAPRSRSGDARGRLADSIVTSSERSGSAHPYPWRSGASVLPAPPSVRGDHPITTFIDAVRVLTLDVDGGTATVPTEHPVLLSVDWLVAIVGMFAPLAVRSLRPGELTPMSPRPYLRPPWGHRHIGNRLAPCSGPA
jgi:hypothetical protein